MVAAMNIRPIPKAVTLRKITTYYFILSLLWFVLSGFASDYLREASPTAYWQDVIGDFTFLVISTACLWYWLKARLDQEQKNEDSIGRLESRFIHLFQDSHLPHTLVNRDTARILDVNDAAVRFYGYSREKLLTMRVSDLNDLGEEKTLANLNLTRTRSTDIFHAKHTLASGKIRDVEIYYDLVDFNGSKNLFTTIVDVTERIQSERESSELNQLLLAMHAVLLNTVNVTNERLFSEVIARTMVESGPFTAAAVLKIPSNSNEPIIPIATNGISETVFHDNPIVWGHEKSGASPTGHAVRDRNIQVVNDFSEFQPVSKWHNYAQTHGILSMASIPIEISGRIEKVLTFYSSKERSFSPSIVQLLNLFKTDLERSFVTSEIANRLESVGIQRSQALAFAERSLFAVVETLSTALEVRDPYTAGHQHNVSWMSCEIARRLKLPEYQIEGLRIGGVLHDIGKVAIPTEILSKPTALSRQEFELVKTHAAIGGDILSKVTFPWPIHQMVTQHHERLDGSGYPHGIKGSSLCIEAQIIAIADTVEAISARRPYREAKGSEVARQAIEQGRGSLLNEEAVDACLSILDDYGIDWLRTAKSNKKNSAESESPQAVLLK
jgi:PAS domain S-box-containing protein